MVAAIMRALGDSKTPLYFLVLTSALNIGLDLVLIIPFHMGVLGAAAGNRCFAGNLRRDQPDLFDQKVQDSAYDAG